MPIRIIFVFLFLSSVICATGNFASLHVSSRNCRESRNSYYVPALTLSLKGKVVRTTEISPSNMQVIDQLDTGAYVVTYPTIFGTIAKRVVVIGSYKKYTLDICEDYFDPAEETYIPIIDQLKEGESYTIRFKSQGCFHSIADSCTVQRSNGNYEILYKKDLSRLSTYDVQKIRVFELELNHMNDGGCTTVDTYEITYEDKKRKIEDGSCNWTGFSNLMADLFPE